MRTADFFASHPVFTRDEFVAARGADRERSPRTADSLLTRQVAAGSLLHVRRGLYAVVPPGTRVEECRPDPYLLASKLSADATVSHHAALQFRGKAYSVWHRFAVTTLAHVRPFSSQGSEFIVVKPPKAVRERSDLGGGIVSEPYAGGTVRVTTLERTLVDVLDQPALCGGWEELWRSLEMVEFFDLDAVVEYALLLRSALTAARVGLFLEQHQEQLFVEDRHLEALGETAPKQPRYLDTTREPGRLVQRWNLIVPERVLRRSWEEDAHALS